MAENQANVSVGNVTQADLNFNEDQRQQAFQEFMSGNPYGGPPRQDQLGLGSQNPDEAHLKPQEPALADQIAAAENRLSELLNGGGTPDPNTELAEWKKKYGDRENEFGELRRKNEELEETLNLLLSQQQAPQAQGQTFSTGYQPPQYSQPQSPAMPNEDPFEGIDDNVVLEGHQIKRLVSRFIAPAIQANFAAAEEAKRELAALRAQAQLETKKAAGISPLDELRLRAKFPMVANMPDGPDKINLMKQLIGRPAQEANPAQSPVSYSAQTPAPAQAPRTPNVVQRLTHIESSNGATGEPNTNPNLPFQVEMANAERQPFHLRAQAMQAVMNKYKVPTVNTFGSGSRYKV